MRTTEIPFQSIEQTLTYEEPKWTLFQLIFLPLPIIMIIAALYQEAGTNSRPLTDLFKSQIVTERTTTETVIEDERAPLPEPKIHMPKNLDAGFFQIQAGQSLCTYLCLRDALDIAIKNNLPLFYKRGTDKIFITTETEALDLAKAGFTIIAIVKPGQRFEFKRK